MIYFYTPVELPIEAATTMGVSVKDGEDNIGKFGTGLKYAIAGILRLGGSVQACIGNDVYKFERKEKTIREKVFNLVSCNGQQCGYTTELGKHWEPWQLFRELASNALDEGGTWSIQHDVPEGTKTVITVDCEQLLDAMKDEKVFLDVNRDPLIKSYLGANVYEGACQHYYYKGIRAGTFDVPCPVTVNVGSGSLSEDRLLDLHIVKTELAYMFNSIKSFSEDLMLSVLAQSGDSSFWVSNIASYHISSELPEALDRFIEERGKWIKNPIFQSYLQKRRRAKGSDYNELEKTEKHKQLLEIGRRLCEVVGVDPIPDEKVRMTNELNDGVLGVTNVATREVWLSTHVAMLGRDEFLTCYLEEAIHAMTGFGDFTREMQNTLFSLIVANSVDKLTDQNKQEGSHE